MMIPNKTMLYLLGAYMALVAFLAFAVWTYVPLASTPADWESDNNEEEKVETSDTANKDETCQTDDKVKILVPGASRTGTSSTKAALQMMGYHTVHWVEFLTDHFEFVLHFLRGDIERPDVRRALRDLPPNSALLDCLVLALFDDLHDAYPKSKVILTTRPDDEWLESFRRYDKAVWLNQPWVTRPDLMVLCYVSRALRLGWWLELFGVSRGAAASLGGFRLETLPELAETYQRSNTVLYAGSQSPSARWPKLRREREDRIRRATPDGDLLEFDLTAGHGFPELVSFLEYEKDKADSLPTDFPHRYTSTSFGSSGGHNVFTRSNRLHIGVAWVALLVLLFGPLLAVPLLTDRDLRLRCGVMVDLVLSYGAVKKVYQGRVDARHFQYGEPAPSFDVMGSHKATKELLGLRLWTGASTVTFEADAPVLPTYLSIDQGTGGALAAVGLAAADLFELRGGAPQKVTVRQSDAGASTAGLNFLKIEPSVGYSGCDAFHEMIKAEKKVNPVRRAYQCKDGRHIFVHGGFPKLKQGILTFFNASNNVESIATAVSEWEGPELEMEMQSAGLAATMTRDPHEWRHTSQYKAMKEEGVISLEPALKPRTFMKLSALPSSAPRPLSDVIVVDFSHVIASPVVGRTLAEHGATVFKVVLSTRARRVAFDEETNQGKVVIELDLFQAAGKARLWDLLRSADLLIDGFTSGVLASFGFDKQRIHAANPNLIIVSLTCYGHKGPLQAGRGFQQNANFITGVAALEDEDLLAYQLISQIDYTTGFLGAYAAILAIIERQKTGRILDVHASLCQTATWMAQYGAEMPTFTDWSLRVWRFVWGLRDRLLTVADTSFLRPSVDMSLTPPVRISGFERWWRAGAAVSASGESRPELTTANNSYDASSVDRAPYEKLFRLEVLGPSRAPLLHIQGRSDLVGAFSSLYPASIQWTPAASIPAVLTATAGAKNMLELSGKRSDDGSTAEKLFRVVGTAMTEHRAVILRSLELEDPELASEFIDFMAPALGWEVAMINGGGTYRTKLTKTVSTSSDEPPARAMIPHTDKAHQTEYPDFIAFTMIDHVPLGAGGETLITNMREVTRTLVEQGVVRYFEEQSGGRVQYLKRFWSEDQLQTEMRGYSWQQAYGASTKVEVEAQLDASSEQWAWVGEKGDVLEVTNSKPVLQKHPETGELVWFNGVHTNHASDYEHADHIDTSRGSPMTTLLTTGAPIDPEVLEKIRAAVWTHSVPLHLSSGEMLLVDNVLVAHGRMSWPDTLKRRLLLTHMKRA